MNMRKRKSKQPHPRVEVTLRIDKNSDLYLKLSCMAFEKRSSMATRVLREYAERK